MNFYNENDPGAAAWLRELIAQGLISPGIVDERSITEIKPGELDDYRQCHFFAGIGGWSFALRLAEWSDDRPVWTASLPCQPFSSGGKDKGVCDDRHLWPVFAGLVSEHRPECMFGEQVARAVGFQWFDGVCADLEAQDYAVGSCVLGAHSKAAPHPRQRLFWTAYANGKFNPRAERSASCRPRLVPTIWESAEIVQTGQGRVDELVARRFTKRVSSYASALLDLDGIPNRMVGMRGAGNAIVPQVGAEFIVAVEETMNSICPERVAEQPEILLIPK